ncbi:peptidoglycan transpeptidase precursor, ErfK-YbiS-YhnG family [Quadrisphaera granulorum]|uniref:Peptidoglycan transpeptidase (ErfK-YbiS-YhnG family) n=1 Tax=Quadrisphaera granulorum TaxID=317664 RepID=A0A316ADL4_9ACTN|nr:peptidoglycan transpeptidase precursor (ErfK-YbiS-YhnG family) [Quadrisphaera granulorum]SZE95208.1 peptidoglycan transpeptidase precursor, ErfK-YbiS-YhnG family [Quadrisphaera granulorum]
MSAASRRAFLLAVAGGIVGGTGLLAGCGPAGGKADAGAAGASPSKSSAPAAQVSLVAEGVGAGGVTSPVPVLRPAVVSGTLQGVVVTAADGSQITGTGAADGSWSPEEPLELGGSYTAVASAVNVDGQVASVSLPFTVTGEDGAVRAKLMPLDGEVVGVGMPVVVIFTREVPKAERARLVEAIQLVSKAPDGSSVEGAWRWIGADRVHWRPKVYWPSGTSVSVKVPLTKVQVGGAWGAADRDVTFTVGDAHVSTADTNTHQMTVRVNGEVARVIPISAGREDSDPAFVTRSGVHLVLEKHADYLMDGRTVGQDYATQVKWATRIANSGEFVHGAPWSVASQGKRNVSHGCLNVSDANAKWFFDLSRRGDVVDITGTDRPMELTNGLGDWVLSWEQWTAPQV